MMTTLLAIILFALFTFLGSLHFYWAIGGEWGLKNASPKKINDDQALKPKSIDCIIVGIGLIFFGVFYFFKLELLEINGIDSFLYFTGWIIPIIFILRAIGDFNYVGFFKKVKETKFGEMDTSLYTPLCVFISISGILIQLFK